MPARLVASEPQDLRLTGHGHQVHAVRLRGHDQPPGRIWHRVHHYVEDVGAAAACFPDPRVLVGHSMGGLVVQRYLEHGPAQGAVLLAPLPRGGTIGVAARLAARHPVVMLKATLSLRLRPFIATPALMLDRGRPEVADRIDTWVRELGKWRIWP